MARRSLSKRAVCVLVNVVWVLAIVLAATASTMALDASRDLSPNLQEQIQPDRPSSQPPSSRPRRPRRVITPDIANISYGPHERNVLDLWLAPSDTPTPLVIYFHGGGFRGGDKSSINKAVIQMCRARGISVAAANYRLSHQASFPAPMHDAARAVQYLRYHAAQYNIDAEQFAAYGGSAGAGISLWLAFHDDLAEPLTPEKHEVDDPVACESTRLVAVGAIAGQASYDPRFVRDVLHSDAFDHPALLPFYGLTADEVDTDRAHALYVEASPIKHLTPDDAPVFMYYTQANTPLTDDVRPRVWVHHPQHGIHLKDRMDEIGLECTLRLREDVSPVPPMQQMVEFFANHFGLSIPKTESPSP